MLQIRPEQFQVYADATASQFRRELTNELSKRMTLSEAEAFAQTSIREGKDIGLTTRGQIRAWARLRADYGPGLSGLDWVAPVLADDALEPSEKLAIIEERALMREVRR